jgi:tetratricopeptide (TPR) repeat protein
LVVGLPLAVSQAAAYMRRMSVTPGEYLAKLAGRKRRWKVLAESEFDRYRRPALSNSILETWDISMEHIQRENKTAYDILHVLVFLDSQNIPLDLIKKAAALCAGTEVGLDLKTWWGKWLPKLERKSPALGSSAIDGEDDDDEVLHAVARLQEFSFLRPRDSGNKRRAYDMHKLVQEATQYALSGRDRRKDEAQYSRLALRAVADLFPESRPGLGEECETYVMHAQRAAEWAELCKGEIEASELLIRVSGYLFDWKRWREKEPVDQRAYEFRRTKLGRKHRDTIQSMVNMASTYHGQGRYEEAEKNVLETLALQREVLGERHRGTIASRASLAVIFNEQRRYEEAEKLKVEVLALQRTVLGERHPDTIRTMANLALTKLDQKRYEEAEKMQVEVLELRRDVLGERHPDTIWSMESMAITWYFQQQHSKALDTMEDCFQLYGEVLGTDHPWTQRSLRTLKTWKSKLESV